MEMGAATGLTLLNVHDMAICFSEGRECVTFTTYACAVFKLTNTTPTLSAQHHGRAQTLCIVGNSFNQGIQRNRDIWFLAERACQ